MTTEAQACPEPSRRIAANRANAQQSTGPKTPEGKLKSCRNALKHGFRAQIILDRSVEIGAEPVEKFAAFLRDLVAELQPVGVLEGFAVETVAVSAWRIRQALHREFDLVNEYDPERGTGFLFPDPTNANAPNYRLPSPERLLPVIRFEAHLERQPQVPRPRPPQPAPRPPRRPGSARWPSTSTLKRAVSSGPTGFAERTRLAADRCTASQRCSPHAFVVTLLGLRSRSTTCFHWRS